MSEYQVYEFLAIDRPLTPKDLAYVRSLSRRVEPTPSHAVFTYAYGDFPGDPLGLLAKHYDIMLYVANWGSKQLAFRFPRTAIDQQALAPYCRDSEEIELSTTGQHVILNIAFLEGESLGWIEDEGYLAPLAPLRDDLLRGDLRALYLAWLAWAERNIGTDKSSEGDDSDQDDPVEPPVPPGLGQLTAPLQAFMEFFEINQDIVGAAALTSPPLKVVDEPIERWVPLLPEAERNHFLTRAARGEPIGAELLRRLREAGGGSGLAASTAPRRRWSAIVAAVKQVRSQRQARERREAERARLAKLDELAQREPVVWAQVPELLARRTASGYDQAVAHLVELRDLAVHRGQRAAFDQRLGDLLAPYLASAALRRRLQERKLVE